MRHHASIIGASIVAVGLSAGAAKAVVIADWTFETSQPATAGPFAPEIGAGLGSGSHAGASVYSSPAGNGSPHSFSSNTWAVGDYYQFQVSTLGQNGLTFAWDETSSATGPRDFKLSYSTDGVTFTDALTYAVLVNGAPNPAWNATTPSSIYTRIADLSGIAAIANQPTVFFRLVDTSTIAAGGGTVASGGTDRVDNVIVASTPEPLTAALGGVGLLALAARMLSRRRTV